MNNYKILRKAQLVDELFMGDDDNAAWEQDQADREWARGLDPDPDPTPMAALDSGALLEVPDEEVQAQQDTRPLDTRSLVAVAAARRWPQMLADLTGNPMLEGIRTVGLCALEKGKGANTTMAALVQWAAQYSETPVLAVEAHFGESRLARSFQAREAGLADTLVRKESLEGLIQDTAEQNLKILTGGSSMSGSEKRTALREFPASFVSLRERFRAVIIELPAVDDPAFGKLPIASLVDAVILVADSKRASPRKLRRAAAKFRDLRAPLVATLLDSTQMLSAQLRHHRLAQQLQRMEPLRGGPR